MTRSSTEPTSRARRKLPRSRRAAPLGSAPGTLIADPSATAPDIHLIAYGADSVEEHDFEDVKEIRSLIGTSPEQFSITRSHIRRQRSRFRTRPE